MKLELNKEIDLNLIVNESNFEMFKYNGHICIIYRVPSGHFCGYVGVKKDSNCYGKNYYTDTVDWAGENNYVKELTKVEEAINDISVHGGLTYANDNLACFKGIFGDEIWWFGFDAAHYDDISLYSYFPKASGSTYKSFEYIKEQVEQLSNQIKEIENINEKE